MSKIEPLTSINASYTGITKLNSHLDKIEAAFQNTLSRDGSTPNSMQANLDMNSNRIINVLEPTASGDVATKSYVDNLVNAITGLATPIAHTWAKLVDGVLTLDSYAALTALTSPGENVTYRVRGRTTKGDGGAGDFYFVSGSTATANGGTILTHTGGRFFRLLPQGGEVDVCWFGADKLGVTSSVEAFNAALAVSNNLYVPPGTYTFAGPITYNYPNPASGSQATNFPYSLTIRGAGADVTNLKWPSGNAITLAMSSQQHSIHMAELTMMTGANGTATAITLTNSYAFFGTFVAQSDFTNVTFRGADGYANANYWADIVKCANVSDINFYGCNFYGTSSQSASVFSNLGNGVTFSQPGAGCFAAGPLNTCGTVYQFVNCNFTFLGTALTYGTNTQSMRVTNCFFGQNGRDLYVPAGATTLQDVAVVGCVFFKGAFGESFDIDADCPNLIIANNLICVHDGCTAINLSVANNFTIIGNEFIPDNTPNGAVGAIRVAGTIAGSIGLITGNTFSSVTKNIHLDTTSTGVTVSADNPFTGSATHVDNDGSGNTIQSFDTGVFTTSVLSSGVGGIGYKTGAGGAVTQLTSKSTTVVLNKPSGYIIMNNAALAAGATVTFQLTNSSITAFTDTLNINVSDGTPGTYLVEPICAAGLATIHVTNISAVSRSEAIVLRYNLIKGVDS